MTDGIRTTGVIASKSRASVVQGLVLQCRRLGRSNELGAETTAKRLTAAASTSQLSTLACLGRELGRFTRVALVSTEHRLSEVQPGFSPEPFLRLTRKNDQEVSKQNRRYLAISVVNASG
jgi:hypothetical protein